jgi:hypothetical protein
LAPAKFSVLAISALTKAEQLATYFACLHALDFSLLLAEVRIPKAIAISQQSQEFCSCMATKSILFTA